MPGRRRRASCPVLIVLVLNSCFILYFILKEEYAVSAISKQEGEISNSRALDDWNICSCSFLKSGNNARDLVNLSLTCRNKAAAIKPIVMCEIASQFTNLQQQCANRQVVPSCKPKLIRITCNMLLESSLPCQKDFVIEQYDYHTQFHCLHAIAQSLRSRDKLLKVPRLLHQVWFYGPNRKMPFQEYLGFISHLRFFKPEALFIWNSGHLPTGRWWQEAITVLNQNQPSVQVQLNFDMDGVEMQTMRKVYTSEAKVYSIVRRPPSTIYSNEIEKTQHSSDIARLESNLLFGGFYADVDTLSLKSLEPLLHYPLTMGQEMRNGLGNMMIFSEPMTPYLFLWHATFFDFQKDEWVEHSINGNYRLSRRCSDLIHVEVDSLLKPNYMNRKLFFHDTFELTGSYMVHLYWRHIDHSYLSSPEKFLTTNNLISRLFRGIFYGTCSVCE